MKLDASIKGLLIAVLLLIISTLTYLFLIKKQPSVFIDNPTEKTILVTIDNKPYILATNQWVKIPYIKGKHSIKAMVDKQFILTETTFVLSADNAVINPTRSSYCIAKQHYGQNQKKDSIIHAQKTMIDEKEYLGETKLDNKLCIDGFDFNLDQAFPSVIKNDTLITRKKIFRKVDYIQYYHVNFE